MLDFETKEGFCGRSPKCIAYLAVAWTSVEKNVQQSVVDKMSQLGRTL